MAGYGMSRSGSVQCGQAGQCRVWHGPSGRYGMVRVSRAMAKCSLVGQGVEGLGGVRCGSTSPGCVRRGSSGLGLVGYGQLWRGKFSNGKFG
jgi:hypothetical protein